jgi:CubicO group peptidase (beta-lactamase class C family)
MRFTIVRPAVAAAVLSLAAAGAQAADGVCAGPDFPRQANEVLAGYQDAQALSGVILFVKDGRVLVRRAYGMADKTWGIPNTLQTRFRIASVGKQFLAAAVLQLAERGKLSIDAPVTDYIPEAPASWRKVTLKQLLNHTSGTPDFTEEPGFGQGLYRPPRSAEDVLKLVRDKPMQFTPGTDFRYDSSGYVLAILIVERVSGQSFADYAQTHIFTPLGMTSSGVDTFGRIVPQHATGYSFSPGGWLEATDLRGVGDIYSTADDLLKWQRGLFGGKVVSPASLKLMTTDWGHGYGFGLVVFKFGEHEGILHNGGEPGWRAALYSYPTDGIVSIALSNFDGIQIDNVAGDLAKACFGITVRPAEVKLPGATLDRYVGDYQIAPGDILHVSRAGDHLLTSTSGDTPTPLYAKNEREFFARIRELEYAFELDASGKSVAMLLSGPGGFNRRLPRIASTGS